MKRNRLQLAVVIVLLISIFMNITCYMRRNEIKREYLDSAYLNLLNVSVLLNSLEYYVEDSGTEEDRDRVYPIFEALEAEGRRLDDALNVLQRISGSAAQGGYAVCLVDIRWYMGQYDSKYKTVILSRYRTAVEETIQSLSIGGEILTDGNGFRIKNPDYSISTKRIVRLLTDGYGRMNSGDMTLNIPMKAD